MPKMTWKDFKKHGYAHTINGVKYVLTLDELGVTVLMPYALYLQQRFCQRCGSILRKEDDLIHGFHWLEE